MSRVSCVCLIAISTGIVLSCQGPTTSLQEGDAAPVSTATSLHTGGLAARIDDADHGGRPLSAVLSGSAVVPGPGDPDGSGVANLALNQGQGEVCFEISVSDVANAGPAHIHVGASGVAGGVVVPLTGNVSSSPSGCVIGVDENLIKAIRQGPSGYYVQVHNPDFPAGAVRGQLFVE